MLEYPVILRIFFLVIVFSLGSKTVLAGGINQPGKLNSTNMVVIKSGYYTPLFIKPGENKKQFVKSFYLDIHTVTNKQFLEFVMANPEWRRSQAKKIFVDKNYLKSWQDDLKLGKNINPSSPVTNVSWFAAKAYCKWAGKRLPSVAEWELAASGNILADGTAKITSNDKLIAWYSEKLPDHLDSVESQGKNKYGVYDMFGLIREWTYDFSNMNINGTAICGAGSADATDLTNYSAFLRYGFRSGLKANSTLANLGFRCAKDF